jgi:putative ABC transport system permease protein
MKARARSGLSFVRRIAGAFLFSALIGVVFRFVPALRAARLDPVETLRHE